MSDLAKKYLIIGPSWVGDMVMAQSVFIDIKRREPNSCIDVLAPAWTSALIDRMPEVTSLINSDFQHGKLSLGGRLALGKKLRDHKYTNAIVLPNSLKSALVPALARIPSRTGFVGEQRWGLLNDIRKLDKNILTMTVQRFIALGLDRDAPARNLGSIPPPKLAVAPQSVNKVLIKNDLSTEQKTLVLCPGAEFGVSKKWPVEHYAEVAQHFLDNDWQIWLMGSKNDLPACDQINDLTGNSCQQLAGETSLTEAIDLISCASLVVSNDSGLMHIAAALQIPLVAIYGSTDPSHTPPLSNNHTIARLDLDCSPCHKRECPLQHHNCMNQLKASSVISMGSELLS